jgi:hypothetical protein
MKAGETRRLGTGARRGWSFEEGQGCDMVFDSQAVGKGDGAWRGKIGRERIDAEGAPTGSG